MKYDDIINKTRPYSNYPRMSLDNRASQFSPFSALSGYDEKIIEASRNTCSMIELSDDEKDELDLKLQFLLNNHVKASFKYFVPDSKKSGGSYNVVDGIIKKVDFVNDSIILDSKVIIKLAQIVDINL